MADLTPDERGALDTATRLAYGVPLDADFAANREDELIWRAARAYQAEQDAKVCEEYIERDEHGHTHGVTSQHSMILAAAIRERAKGLA